MLCFMKETPRGMGPQPHLLSGSGDLCAGTDDKSEGFSPFQTLPTAAESRRQSL